MFKGHLKEGFFFIRAFMLDIIIQLDISVRLISQVTTIIYHHMKKNY